MEVLNSAKKKSTAPNQDFNIATPSRPKFQATQLWKTILRRFYQEMPLKSHKRQFRIFDNTFTGKEAVDFLMNLLPLIVHNKTTDRQITINLLGKFLQFRYFVNVRSEGDLLFYDNVTLYKFCGDKIKAFLEDSPVAPMSDRRLSKDIRRVSSLKASSLESYHKSLMIEAQQQKNNNNISIFNPKSSDKGSAACPQNLVKQVHNELCSTPQSTSKRNMFPENRNNRRGLSPFIRSFRKASPTVATQTSRSRSISPKQRKVIENANQDQVFCERIDQREYKEQARSQEQFMLNLLDQIIKDDNLTTAEKFEKLKKFRITYPSVYALRFSRPENDPTILISSKQPYETPQKGLPTVGSIKRRFRQMVT